MYDAKMWSNVLNPPVAADCDVDFDCTGSVEDDFSSLSTVENSKVFAGGIRVGGGENIVLEACNI